MNIIKSLSVFFPAVNEEGNIENTVKKAVDVLKDLKLEYEVIIIDDGSKDKTGEIADKMAKNNPLIKVVHHPKNLGYGSALKTGFSNAKYSWVAFMDSDGQFDFNEIKLLLEKSDKADVILGYRLNRADPFSRKVFTFGWQMMANILLRLNTKDYSCGFKLIKKQVFEKVQPLEGEEKVTQIELLVKARRLGYKFAEVGVHHFPRVYGNPTGAKLSVVIKSLFDLFKLWWKIKEEKLAFFGIAAIVLLAAVLRFYRLNEYMTFLGDEGRDALIIKDLLVNGNVPFIGPPTSVGNIYLGPLYYYMMAIPMSLFWLNPVAAAGMNALIGILTVVLIYYLGKIWFGRMSALIAAYLYAISPVAIIYSRSSWNPNPAPFFSLLGVWFLYKAHKTNNYTWLILTGVFAAAALQMHYLAIILLPIFGLLWLVELIKTTKGQSSGVNLFLGTVGAVMGFWFTMLPLVLFDFKHNFPNYRAIIELFLTDKAVSFEILPILVKMPIVFFNNLIGRHIAGQDIYLSFIVSTLILLPVIKLIYDKVQKGSIKWSYLSLYIWLLIGLIGVSFYQNDIYDHYLGFMNPAPFLLLGGAFSLIKLDQLKSYKSVYLLFWGILIISLSIVNFLQNPLQNYPNNQLKRTQDVAKLVIEKSANEPFNFALIAKSNYDAAYQYYLDIYGYKPLQVPMDIANQLFVVCEDTCDPMYSSKYEIAAFGMTRVDWKMDFEGVKLYRMLHNPEAIR